MVGLHVTALITNPHLAAICRHALLTVNGQSGRTGPCALLRVARARGSESDPGLHMPALVDTTAMAQKMTKEPAKEIHAPQIAWWEIGARGQPAQLLVAMAPAPGDAASRSKQGLAAETAKVPSQATRPAATRRAQ